MTLEYEIPQFLDWFLKALIIGLPLAIAMIAVVGCFIGFAISATRRGPVEGFYAVAKVIASGVNDVVHFSFRRMMAMMILAWRESIRRRVLIVIAIFAVVMLLAGWYLDVKSENPARLYLSFVLTASNYLVLVLALFLSTFSIPNDVKHKTIQTVVTKPVRPLEIILGRIVGFTAVGTLILLAMGVVSWVFVVRGLRHEHTVEIVERQTQGQQTVWQGRTDLAGHHRHTFQIGEDGTGETDRVMGHQHVVTRNGEEASDFQVGRAFGMLQARIPKRGDLRFLDRSGKPGSGINVGNEWMYRSYIEGGTLAAAIWTFDGMTANRYPDGVPLELNIRVFRTHKGNIEKGIRGSIFIDNPNPAAKYRRSEEIPFVAKEFVIDRQFIPRKIKAVDREGVVRDVDLFEDLTENGRMELRIQCSDPGQYFGMAEADVYILEANAPFWWNFAKGYIGIWLQMVLVTSFGVMFSTFLTGPVAMMATLISMVLGFFGEFVRGMAEGEILGGGPIESLIRLLTQQNVMSDMEIGTAATRVVQGLDWVFLQFLQMAVKVLPDFGSSSYESLNTVSWVAYGYNIDPTLLGIHVLETATYIFFVAVVGYFFLKTREVAA